MSIFFLKNQLFFSLTGVPLQSLDKCESISHHKKKYLRSFIIQVLTKTTPIVLLTFKSFISKHKKKRKNERSFFSTVNLLLLSYIVFPLFTAFFCIVFSCYFEGSKESKEKKRSSLEPCENLLIKNSSCIVVHYEKKRSYYASLRHKD